MLTHPDTNGYERLENHTAIPMAVAAAEPRQTSTDGRTDRLPFGAGREVHVVQTPRRMSSPNPETA